MTTFQIVFLVHVLVGVALALVIWRSEELRGHLLVQLAGIACLAGGLKLMYMTRESEDPRVMLVFVLAWLPYVPFLIFLFFFWVGQALAALSSDHEPTAIAKTYTAAEKAEAQGNFKRAIMLYRREIERDQKDMEARRRLAKVLVRDNQVDEAIGELRLAATMTEDPDEEVEFIIQVSDLLLNRKLDFDTALVDLDILRKKHQGTPAGSRAQKRFQRVYILSEARKEREEEAGP